MEQKLQRILLGGRRGAALMALPSLVSHDATTLPLCPGPPISLASSAAPSPGGGWLLHQLELVP